MRASIVVVICVVLAFNAIAQQKGTVAEEAFKYFQEQNKKAGEESSRKATEVEREFFRNQNLNSEEIYFKKVKSEMLSALRSAIYNRVRDENINHSKAEKYISDTVESLIVCQRKSWALMPKDLKQHILSLSKKDLSTQAAHRMAMEDYKERSISSGISQDDYLNEVMKWAKEYKLCESAMKINLEDYKN